LTVGLVLIGGRYSFTRRVGDSKAASPSPGSRGRGCGELVEINRCGGRDSRTRVGECTRGGGTVDGSNSGQVNHIEVVTGHELDIELLPCSSLVWAPPNGARATLLEDISGTWFCRRDVCQGSQGEG